MIKGIAGTGSGRGQLNDEDWNLPFGAGLVPYSNTLSAVGDAINYGVIDVGYDWWRGSGYRIAPYIGYSFFLQDMEGYGCRQIANRFSDCVPQIPASVLGITEDDA
jgi:hypothetical protein